MLIKSSYPIDGTFFSSILNESILYFANSVKCSIIFDDKYSVIISSDDNLEDCFRNIYSSVRAVDIGMVRNDRHFIKDFKKYFNISFEIRQTFRDLLTKIQENVDELKLRYDNINLTPHFKGSVVLLESDKRNVDIILPQLYKVDRFTGFTSLETSLTTKQLKLRCLGETILLLLLGLTTSYVCSRKDGDNWYYFFLTFAPDEILKLYLEGDKELIRKYFLVKKKVVEILSQSYAITSVNEVALVELILNLAIQILLSKYNMDKISFILFKVAREGQDSYKIYEQLPITIYRKIAFTKIVEQHFRDSDGLIKSLVRIFENKNSRLWKSISSLNTKNKYNDADNVLKALQALYRFVVLGDLHGYHQFTREIFNCYQKTENEQYKRILEGLRWF